MDEMDEYEADEYELYILRRAGDLAPLEKERISLNETLCPVDQSSLES